MKKVLIIIILVGVSWAQKYFVEVGVNGWNFKDEYAITLDSMSYTSKVWYSIWGIYLQLTYKPKKDFTIIGEISPLEYRNSVKTWDDTADTLVKNNLDIKYGWRWRIGFRVGLK